jgi:signal recognition particle receptor subunit beta
MKKKYLVSVKQEQMKAILASFKALKITVVQELAAISIIIIEAQAQQIVKLKSLPGVLAIEEENEIGLL